uniref:Epididymal-specific lipocalin-6-like n=1 Tax=Callorhinus ursinus TaxID=34884 RepID=A0A3Q7PYW8_CALUR
QVGFGAERGFRATGAVSGSQDPLCGTLVAAQVQLVGPLSLLGLCPDPEPRTDGLSSRLERCDVNVVELLRQSSGWVFENPSLGVLDYRVLGTNFRDYAIVFTQLEFKDEAFNTVELYSRTELASQEALRLFARWSKGLGFLSQQQATLLPDLTCAHKAFQVSCLPEHHPRSYTPELCPEKARGPGQGRQPSR